MLRGLGYVRGCKLRSTRGRTTLYEREGGAEWRVWPVAIDYLSAGLS